MRLVVDASVTVKWLLGDPDREVDTSRALALMEAVAVGRASLCQPVHWLVEVAAVMVRLCPDRVATDLALLNAMETLTLDTLAVYQRAAALSGRLNHHLFDTQYHAVALEIPGATLVTADVRYFEKAQAIGNIALLAHWSGPG